MPRRSKKPRRLVADGRVYMWTMRHSHGRDGDGRSVDCRQTLTIGNVLQLPPTVDIETGGKAFGMGRTKAYELARNEKFPCQVVKAGGAYRVVTADLLRVLAVDTNVENAAAAA
ncbi:MULTISPECIES: hypothetical protein [unclassified Streptomyces]|uniref:hypothetical protein n=1 Tax=unclassified Streptomyces TaxID=2593676 RepID=UPI002B1CF869|nr:MULTISPECIES: hypothetical protein [unclassified Streptomyces]